MTERGVDLELLRAYEPVLRYTSGELFFPTAVEGYVEACSLWEFAPNGTAQRRVAAGELDVDRLVHESAVGGELSLRFVDKPLGRREYRAWRRRPDRPAFTTTGRFAEVGLIARLIDVLFRFSLMLRGRVPGGLSAAADVLSRERLDPATSPYYGRVVREGGFIALQYWFFYAMNDWRSRFGGANDHEGDWEHVIVYLADNDEGAPTPVWVACSAHDEVGDDLRRRWDDPEIVRVGDHIVIHPGAGSHSGAFVAGDYVTAVEPPGIWRTVLNGARRLIQVIAPWSRGEIARGLGIPFVDYSRGDGVAIGPGCARGWSPVLIDDEVPWVRDFRGLWGLDTRDRFGGERAPAGPRYERSGAIRQSWADPLGWTGLHKVAPTPTEYAALIDRRLAAIDEEAAALSTSINEIRRTMRSAVIVRQAGGSTAAADHEVTDLERELQTMVARHAALGDDVRALQRAYVEAPADPGPQAHLRHKTMPIGQNDDTRARFLRVWSTISTPLLFVAAAFVLASQHLAIITGAALFIVVFLAIEAIARRSFLAFVATLVVVVVAVAIGLATVRGLFGQWQVVIAALFAVAAGATLAVNLRDLRR